MSLLRAIGIRADVNVRIEDCQFVGPQRITIQGQGSENDVIEVPYRLPDAQPPKTAPEVTDERDPLRNA